MTNHSPNVNAVFNVPVLEQSPGCCFELFVVEGVICGTPFKRESGDVAGSQLYNARSTREDVGWGGVMVG